MGRTVTTEADGKGRTRSETPSMYPTVQPAQAEQHRMTPFGSYSRWKYDTANRQQQSLLLTTAMFHHKYYLYVQYSRSPFFTQANLDMLKPNFCFCRDILMKFLRGFVSGWTNS